MSHLDVSVKLSEKTVTVQSGLINGHLLYSAGGINSEDTLLLLDLSGEVDVPIQPADVLFIQGEERFVLSGMHTELPDNPLLKTPISFHLNDQEHSGEGAFTTAKATALQLKELSAPQSGPTRLILDIDGFADEVISDDQVLIISKGWRFLTIPIGNKEDAIDLEECSKHGKGPGLSHFYKIRINDSKYTVDTPHMTGKDLLQLAGIDPTKNALCQKTKGGGTKRIDADEKADFTTPGIERFVTIPLDMTEGLTLRRQFQLSSSDTAFLDSLGLSWEAVIEGSAQRVVIYDFPLPDGYTAHKTDLYLRVEAGYPDVQIDMAYFYPSIQRSDGKIIRATSSDQFDGKQWQRWSRHRTPSNPWRPGVDCISTHVEAVKSWFLQELLK